MKRFIKMFAALALVIIASYGALNAYNYLYPSELMCGLVVRNANQAFGVALELLGRGTVDVKPASSKDLADYVAEHPSCCRAESTAEQGGSYWAVFLELPSRCGYLVNWAVRVQICGGTPVITGTFPVNDSDPKNAHC